MLLPNEELFAPGEFLLKKFLLSVVNCLLPEEFFVTVHLCMQAIVSIVISFQKTAELASTTRELEVTEVG